MPTGIPKRHKQCEDCSGLYMPRSGAQRRCPACRALHAVRQVSPRPARRTGAVTRG